MALLNRFSKLNDRGETGIFTFIVTKSVTRDLQRDATTKDFCFGYHRWAISFQRNTERLLGVHLLLRNPTPSTACVVDFTLSLLNRQHFSLNQVYSKRQAKFTITNCMQGVSRWIQMSDLAERRFSNESGEFLLELSMSNMSTIFECDLQLAPAQLAHYKSMLRSDHLQQPQPTNKPTSDKDKDSDKDRKGSNSKKAASRPELINLETNYFTFGAFDWSLSVVPLTLQSGALNSSSGNQSSSSLSLSSSNSSSGQQQPQQQSMREPVCRVYLNRLTGLDCLCRVKYRVILGHHLNCQTGGQQNQASSEFVDSKMLDQISDSGGRVRGHQFRKTNILKLISLRSTSNATSSSSCQSAVVGGQSKSGQSGLDLRVHIEMFCANTLSEAKVSLGGRKANEPQISNCLDRNKQAWCVESDTSESESENVRLKLFFMDLHSVPKNHIRYISWIVYIVSRECKSNTWNQFQAVRNAPHSNYYLQDGIDMGTIMESELSVKQLRDASISSSYLDSANQLSIHIEWVDSLLLFSHLYNNYDSMATVQRHQVSRELCALQVELEQLERKYEETKRKLSEQRHQQQQQQLCNSDYQSQDQRCSFQSTTSNSTSAMQMKQPKGSSNDRTLHFQAANQQHQHLQRQTRRQLPEQPSKTMTSKLQLSGYQPDADQSKVELLRGDFASQAISGEEAKQESLAGWQSFELGRRASANSQLVQQLNYLDHRLLSQPESCSSQYEQQQQMSSNLQVANQQFSVGHSALLVCRSRDFHSQPAKPDSASELQLRQVNSCNPNRFNQPPTTTNLLMLASNQQPLKRLSQSNLTGDYLSSGRFAPSRQSAYEAQADLNASSLYETSHGPLGRSESNLSSAILRRHNYSPRADQLNPF